MPPEIHLEPWDESGLGLLRAMNTPAQKRHLGGPEAEAKLLDRHARYLTYHAPGEVEMLRIVVSDRNAGSVGYWENTWRGELGYEAGWELLPDHHGKGIGGAAARQLIGRLMPIARHRHVFAFPTPDNAGSNGICRALGFELLGVFDIEYPKGSVSPHNAWRLDLGHPLPPRP